MPKIFISYRRKDSAPIVGRIYERLVREFGEANIFYDIEDIPKGVNFSNVLRQSVASCDVLLAMIGPQWAAIVDAKGNKRLFDENDYVRYEVDTALRIPKVTVIPVLIGDADMPSKGDLPPVLHALTDLNAMKIRNDPDFRRDMDDLIKAVKPRRSPTTAGLAVVFALIAVAIGFVFFAPRLFQSVAAAPTATQSPIATFTLTHEPSVTPLPPSLTPSPTDEPAPVPSSQLAAVSISVPSIVLPNTTIFVTAWQGAHCIFTPNDGNIPFGFDTSTGNIQYSVKHVADTIVAIVCEDPQGRHAENQFVVSSAVVPSAPPTLAATVTSLPPSPFSVVDNAQLHVFATHESLTLYVSQGVSLNGFQFGVIIDGQLKLNTLVDSFNSLKLTDGLANANACYVYQADGSTPPLSQSCKGQIFRTDVAAADVFWYDSVTNQPRDLAIFRDSQTIGIICSAATPDCAIEWAWPAIPTLLSPTSTLNPVISATPLVDASIVPIMNNYVPRIESFNGIQYAYVPAGEFDGQMINEFWIGVYEVTNAEFVIFLNSDGKSNLSQERFKLFEDNRSGGHIRMQSGQWVVEDGFGNHPAVRISWYGARDYCNFANARLPSIVEWRKASVWNPITDKVTIYPWGDALPTAKLANFGNVTGMTMPVDALADGKSPVGAYNMSGNAEEFVADILGSNRMRYGGGWTSIGDSLIQSDFFRNLQIPSRRLLRAFVVLTDRLL